MMSGCVFSALTVINCSGHMLSTSSVHTSMLYSPLSYAEIYFHRVPMTMLASAVWHGLNPGYYLCLMNVPLILLAQDKLENSLKNKLTGAAMKAFGWVNWFLTMWLFSYLSIAFLMLDISSTLFYWKSIYFFGHIVIASIFIFGIVFTGRKSSNVKSK